LFGGILEFVFLFGYVSGNNSFPDILTPEEEEKHILAYLSGDNEAKNKLIEHNLRLVAHIAKKYTQNNRENTSDLISIGTIGLIKGVNTYKPDKKTKLATYAAKCIENEILMHIRSSKRYASDISLQDIIGIDGEGNEVKVEDKIPLEAYSIEDTVDLQMQTKQLYEKIGKVLKERERLIIELRYGLTGEVEMTQREIADKLGISRSYV